MDFENNLRNSFRKVREEIENLQHQISELNQKVEDINLVILKKEKTGKKVKKKAEIKKKK